MKVMVLQYRNTFVSADEKFNNTERRICAVLNVISTQVKASTGQHKILLFFVLVRFKGSQQKLQKKTLTLAKRYRVKSEC